MPSKNQDSLPKTFNGHLTYNKVDHKPFTKLTALILVVIYILQTCFIYLEITLKSLTQSTSYYTDSILSATNFVLAREAVNILQLTGWQIFLLICVVLYIVLILIIVLVLLIRRLQGYKGYNWIMNYSRTIIHIHFYCLSLPIHTIMTEVIVQSFPLSSARLWLIFSFSLINTTINLAGCLKLFYGSINTNPADPLSMINDYFLKFTCVQRTLMCLINLLVFQEKVVGMSSIAVNIIYLALTLIHILLFFYTLPFYHKGILNLFLFETGVSFLFSVINIIYNSSDRVNSPGVSALILIIAILPVYMKLATNWKKSQLTKTLSDTLNFRFFGQRKNHMNKYWFLQGVYELKSVLEFRLAKDTIPISFPKKMLKQLGLTRQWIDFDFPDVNINTLNPCELKINNIIPMLMNTWRKMCPQDYLVTIVLAEFMVDELNLIYEPYTILEDVLNNNVKVNIKLRALELRDKIQKSLHKNVNDASCNLDLSTFFETFQAIFDLKYKIASQMEESSYFYQHLQDNNINLFSVMNSGRKLQILNNSVLKCWNSIPTQLHESNIILLLIYGLYKLYMTFEYKEGKELLETFSKISKKRALLTENSEIDHDTLFSTDNVSILISTEKGSLGNIVFCSKNVSKIMGRKYKSLIGQNVKIMMPQFFQEIHDFFIQKKLTRSENILETKHFQQFAVDEKGFAFPVNIVVTVYPWINKGFLFAGIIRKIHTRAKYILLDDHGNISCYSKTLLSRLSLPHPDLEQKVNILEICETSETFAKLFIKKRMQERVLDYEQKEQYLQSEAGESGGLPSLGEKAISNNMYFKLASEINSSRLKSSPALGDKIKGETLYAKKILIEREIMNFWEYKPDNKMNNYAKRLKIQTSQKFSRESSIESSPRRFETAQPSQYAPSKKQIQFYCTVSSVIYGEKSLKILELNEVIVSLEDNVQFQKKLLNPINLQPSKNLTSPLPNKKGFEASPKSAFSKFSRQAGPRFEKNSASPEFSELEDSVDIIDEIDIVDENQIGHQVASQVRHFFAGDLGSIKTPDENTHSETYGTGRISEPNGMPLETNMQRLMSQAQSDVALSSNFHYFRKGQALSSEDKISREFRINLNTSSELDSFHRGPLHFPLQTPREKQDSERKESLLWETTEGAQLDSKGFLQDPTSSAPKINSKMDHFDLKLAISNLPILKITEIRVPFVSLIISLAALLAASVFAYNFAVNTLPVIEDSFDALRKSLDHIIQLADITYSLAGLSFLLNNLAVYNSNFTNTQQTLKDKLISFNTGNTQLIEQINLFSQTYRDFVYKKDIKIYMDDFQDYIGREQYAVYFDTIQALNLISNRATEITILPTSQKAILRNYIDFLRYNAFNSLLLELQEQPEMITQEIENVTQTVKTASDVVLAVIPSLFGITIIMMTILFIKSYIDIRNFLENFAYFQPSHLKEILANMDWLRELTDLDTSTQEKNNIKKVKKAVQTASANNTKINFDKVIKTKGLKMEICKKLPLMLLLLIIPIAIVVPSQRTFASSFQSITPTISNVVKPKDVIAKTLLVFTQTGMFNSIANFRIYDQNASIVLAQELQEIEFLLTEAQMPTTADNFVLLHGDICQYVNATKYQSCKTLFNGASNSGVVGAISAIVSFVKYWKAAIDARNTTILSMISGSTYQKNSYDLTMIVKDAVNYVENQMAEDLTAKFRTIEKSNTTFIILSLIISLMFCIIGVVFVYFPSKEQRQILSRLVLLFPRSAIFANHRLKLYLRENASLGNTAMTLNN